MAIAQVTDHARQRAKDRLGVSKKTADKIANKALEFGITHSQAKGSLQRYISKLYLTHLNGSNIRVYNRKVYIFRADVLITIINLPVNLISAADKIQKNINSEYQKVQ